MSSFKYSINVSFVSKLGVIFVVSNKKSFDFKSTPSSDSEFICKIKCCFNKLIFSN